MDEDGTGLDPGEELRARSQRAGVLGGLAAVGLLLAVLVLVAPGGSKPRLPARASTT